MADAQSVHICAQVAEVLDLDSDVLTEGSDDHFDADPGQHKDQDHAASTSTIALLIVVLLLAPLHNVHFVKYDGPVVKSWNPKYTFWWEKNIFEAIFPMLF